MGLIHFDDWASDYGETVTAIELSPEGSGYRPKTRFAKFFNLPELMATFKMVADVQTADMLKLPVPKANFHTEVIHPSELQKKAVAGLAERAERVRARVVDPSTDNMLRITNDGRKLALDMRLLSSLAPDDENSKVSVCARNVYRIWAESTAQRSTQLIFCDLSTPKADGSFNVYDDLRRKLLEIGIPENEIAYIHTANTEQKKKELFAKVRGGEVRILMGSTAKWEPEPMCRTGSSPCMISIAHGGPATCSSALGASCGRATKIRRWRSSAMLPRAHSMPTSISWWNPSSGLLPRS